jgi:hypothetical protein
MKSPMQSDKRGRSFLPNASTLASAIRIGIETVRHGASGASLASTNEALAWADKERERSLAEGCERGRERLSASLPPSTTTPTLERPPR